MMDSALCVPETIDTAETELVILVDENDEPIGLDGKVSAHLGEGKLHRAFTIVLFDSAGRVLLARRSAEKMLWPLWWDSACASHPRVDESYENAGRRRLIEELGFDCPLVLADKFAYHVPFQTVGSEREVCATLVGIYDGDMQLNPEEVAEVDWVEPGRLMRAFAEHPGEYAPWFVIAMERLIANKTLALRGNGESALFLDKSLKELLSRSADLVEPVIEHVLTGGDTGFDCDATLFQVASGGKRMRPALTVISAMLLGGSLDDALVAGASLEILHNATLIADDIIDHSELRRGEPTLWKRYGHSYAQCAVLDYCGAIFEPLNQTAHAHKLVPLLATTLRTIVDGELLDILFERAGREGEAYVTENRLSHITVEDYGQMAYGKTASLFEAACAAGGICADASDADMHALRSYGRHLGLAFQIRDDILDIFGDEATFGKQIGRDIYERKFGNLLLLVALEHMPAVKRREVLDILNKETELTAEEVSQVIREIERTDARKLVSRLADGFAEQASASLDRLPDNEWRGALAEFVSNVVDRHV